jgi:DNA-binding SARP family transcriptional activator/tetratricopeptide (TPR) repeat protein
MEFRVLGPVSVWLTDRQADAGNARQRAVLAVLLLELGRVVPLDVLIERVWGENPPRSARNLVYGYVGRLRRLVALAEDPAATLHRRRDGYLMQTEPDHVDVDRFRRLVAEATAVAGDDDHCAALLGEAVALWRGQALAGLDSPWLNGHRVRLELERDAAALDLGDIRLRRGEHGALAGELAGRAAESPADERLIGQLMLALYRCGRQAESLLWFEQTRRHLADELGTHPSPQLCALHEQILRADPSLALGPASASGPAVPVPRQLPADVPGFTCRVAELAELDRLLPSPAQADAVTDVGGLRVVAAVISAIGGMGGVGKTALAVHWAHRVTARFPDGQLYVNLRGFDPSGAPVIASAAIHGFLHALGVAPERIPADPQAQAGLYRSLLAGRRMLVVLDNARDEQQVRPLLPASPGSLVVITSRNQLAGLAVTDGARLLSLDVLSHNEACQLLATRLGHTRAAAEPEATAEIARLCGCLPLALAVAASRLAVRPRLSLAALATELRGAPGRLDALDSGDPAASVRSVFSWSTGQLSPSAARMFRLLGLHPGPDITAPACSSLAGCEVSQARHDLSELTLAHLITEHLPGRYVLHDLLRAHAGDQARTAEDDQARRAAIGRVLDHYLQAAWAADVQIRPSRLRITLAPSRPGVTAERPSSHQQALAWFDAEHRVLLSAVALAADAGFDVHAWQLPWTLAVFLDLRGRWQEWAATGRIALAAAARLDDPAAQVHTLRLLGAACGKTGDYQEGRAYLTKCLELCRELGDRVGEATVHHNLAGMSERQGQYEDALGHARRALSLFQAIGGRAEIARASNVVGWQQARVGDYRQARPFCQQAVKLSRETGERLTEAAAWDSLGYAERHLGNFAEAVACYQRALSIFREFGDLREQATTLIYLGDTQHAAEAHARARDAWQQALAILENLQHPEADQVRAKLAEHRVTVR